MTLPSMVNIADKWIEMLHGWTKTGSGAATTMRIGIIPGST